MTQATAPFDARALTEPIDKKAARAFWKSVRPSGTLSIGPVIGLIFVGVFAVAFVGIFSTIARSFFQVGIAGGPLSGVFLFVPLVFIVVVGTIVVGLIRSIAAGGPAVTAYRLDRFARANNMAYDAGVKDASLPGMIFQQGHDRRSSSLVRGWQPRFVEFGNYIYKTGSGKNESTHRWGYVAIKLDAPLPNIVLDARSNNGLFGSNLPESLARSQRLSLEGDFDEHFSLYCPTGYEQDALYLFTPDIMARFVDHAAALDVEIVDDWLFLYAQRDLSTLDPATWQWLFATVGAILGKMAQWSRWRDDRLRVASAARNLTAAAGSSDLDTPVAASTAAPAQHPFVATSAPLPPPPPGVAPRGRRLRTGVPVSAIVIGVMIVIGWLWMFAH